MEISPAPVLEDSWIWTSLSVNALQLNLLKLRREIDLSGESLEWDRVHTLAIFAQSLVELVRG